MIKKIFNKSLSSSTKRGLKNSLYLTIASILTKIILLIGFVYIPNRLGIHNFGLYSTALSFIGIFYIFGFDGIAKVIIREFIQNKKNILKIINNIFNFKLFLAIIQIISIICISFFFTSYNNEVLIIILIASNEILFKGMKVIPSALLQAHEEIKILAKINVTHSLLRVSGMVILLFFINNLLYMMLYIAFINIIFLIIYYKKLHKFIQIPFSIHLTKINLPIKILKQGFVFTLIGIGSTLSTKIDVFMLSLMGSTHDVAIYSLSEKIILQFEMLRGVVLTAFYPIVIKHFKTGNAKLSTLLIIASTIFTVTSLFAGLYAYYAQDIINFLYDNTYTEVANISMILIFYLVLIFSNLPFSIALQSVGLEKYILYMYPFSITLNILLNYYLFHTIGMIGLTYSTLAVQFFILVFLMSITFYQLKLKGHTL